MSKLPVLMRGSGGGFDYICIAVRGNVAFGVKLDHCRITADAFRTDFRVRAAVITPEFYARVTKGGEATQTFAKPSEAFPGDWANDAPFRASFEKQRKDPIEVKIADDGSFPMGEQLPLLIEDAINGFMSHVQMPDDAIIIVSKDELRDHIVKLMYPSMLTLWGYVCEQHFADNPLSQAITKGQGDEAKAKDSGKYEPSLGDAEDLLEGEDDDDADDDDDDGWDTDPELEDPEDEGDDEPKADDTTTEPVEENVDYSDNVTPFPKSGE